MTTSLEQTQHLNQFLESVLDPTFIDSLHESNPAIETTPLEIHLEIYNFATKSFNTHTLKGLLPFMTLYDIKLAIYNLMRQEDKALPDFTFIGRPQTIGKKSGQAKRLETIDFAWSMSAAPMEKVSLYTPLDQVKTGKEADDRFVETSGERRIIGRTNKERITIEDQFLQKYDTVPTLQVFFYDDLVKLCNVVPKPISEREWNGRFWPYFPALSQGSRPTEEQREQARFFAKKFSWRRRFFSKIESILTEGDPLLIKLKLTGVKQLKFIWGTPTKFSGIEEYFYVTPVNDRRPYMRLMPAEDTPISKIHLLENGNPDLEDPRLLVQWTQDRHSQTPGRDSIMMKILYRKSSGSINPLYFTMHLFADGTADMVIEPPKGIRKLDPRSELNELPKVLDEGLRGFSYLNYTPSLVNCNFIFSLSLRDSTAPHFTQESLRAKLGLFKAAFQEIPAFLDEKSILNLRYKLISNFSTEGRIRTFITQLLSRKYLKGEDPRAETIRAVSEHFQISVGEARQHVAAKLESSGDFIATEDMFLLNENNGVDIAIFGQHPNYHVHLYRVNSVSVLRRIITLISLLFSKSKAELEVPAEGVEEVEGASAPAVESDEEEVEPVPVPVPVPVAPVKKPFIPKKPVIPSTTLIQEETKEEDDFENVTGAQEDDFENVTGAAPEADEEAFENVTGAAPEAQEDAFENVTGAAPEAQEEAPKEEDAFESASPQAQPQATVPEAYSASQDASLGYLANFAFEDEETGPTIEEFENQRGTDVAAESVPVPIPEESAGREEASVLPTPKKFQFGSIALPPASTPPPPAKKFQIKQKAGAPSDDEEEESDDGKKGRGKGFTTYFSDKLMEADRQLFDITKTHPSLKKYVSQCGANVMRQPAVLNEDEFESMKAEYKAELDSDEIEFYVFPLDKDRTKEPYNPKKEYYTIMKYGSTKEVQNYYLCCKYFCTRDNILVREVDLKGTELRRPVVKSDGRKRTTKDPMTCPFCEGLVIKDREYPGANEVILERKIKPRTTDRRHLFIRFLKKTNHPDGLYLPCCFIEDQPVRIGNPAYPEARAPEPAAAAAAAAAPAPAPTVRKFKLKKDAVTVPVDAEDAAAFSEPAVISRVEDQEQQGDLIVYEDVLRRAKFSYIVGAEKFPLEGPEQKFAKVREGSEEPRGTATSSPPQIGLLPTVLNAYFSQEPNDLVSRTSNPQKLKQDAQGFLRIGVENRNRFKADSFLAATALFFGKNSVKSFKEYLTDIIQPRIFLALNYGNLALEMYDAASGRPRPEEMPMVRKWATDMLGVKKKQSTDEQVVRAYMAYYQFKVWLSSETSVKEYRHFAHLFSQPGLLETGVQTVAVSGAKVSEYRRPGIIFIVLDILKSGEVKVRCPPYPISKETFARADIGFLSHHWSGIWEPLFYVDNRSLGERDLSTFFLSFPANRISERFKHLPERVREFATQCSSQTSGRGAFTSQSSVNSTRIVPITTARERLKTVAAITLYGLIRDSYNHVAALVYQRIDPVSKRASLIAVPVVDDGIAILETSIRVFMDWDDFEPASITDVIAFYRDYIIPPGFPKYYTPMHAVRSRGTTQIVAIRLQNGLYVPVAPVADVPAAVVLPEPEMTIEEMEWTINRRLAMGSLAADQAIPGEETRLRLKEFGEVYEHLRLTFSNWFATLENSSEFKRELIKITERGDLPLFERRKRLEILLGPEIERWLAESDEDKPRQSSLLRVDCRLQTESCDGMCQWSKEGEGEKQCLLHVPATSPIEGTTASGTQVLLRRLIEELIRYGGKRKQLFEQRVSRLSVIDREIKEGDQYIVPEKSAAWADLLRLEWLKDTREMPRFWEEMTRVGPAGANAAAEAPLAALTEQNKLPERLITMLGGDIDPKIAPLRLYLSPSGDFDAFLTLFNTGPEDPGITAEADALTPEMMMSLVKRGRVPIVQYDLRVDPPTVLARQPYSGPKEEGAKKEAAGYPVFVLQTDVAPAFLVLDPDDPKTLSMAELPDKLLREFIGAKKVFGAVA